MTDQPRIGDRILVTCRAGLKRRRQRERDLFLGGG